MLVKVVGTPLIHILSLLAQATSFIPEVPAKRPAPAVQEKVEKTWQTEYYEEWKAFMLAGDYSRAMHCETELAWSQCKTCACSPEEDHWKFRGTQTIRVKSSLSPFFIKAYMDYVITCDFVNAYRTWCFMFGIVIEDYDEMNDCNVDEVLVKPELDARSFDPNVCKLAIAKVLWQEKYIQRFSHHTDFLEVFDKELYNRIDKSHIAYIRWALQIMKTQRRLTVLNNECAFHKWGCYERVIEKKYSGIRYHQPSPNLAIRHVGFCGYLDTVTILLQHGVKPVKMVCECKTFISRGFCNHQNDLDEKFYSDVQNNEKMIQLIKCFIFLCPRILELIKNSSSHPSQADAALPNREHLLARRALYLSQSLASEFIIDSLGNNPLHCAVLAQNAFLIKLLLMLNPLLIDSTNNTNRLSPLVLAYSKNLHISLKAIIECAYAINDEPVMNRNIFN